MDTSRKCEYCSRWYVGDGYKGSCTRECYYEKEYRKRHDKVIDPRYLFVNECARCGRLFKNKLQSTKYCSDECRYPKRVKSATEKANERWLNGEKKEKKPQPLWLSGAIDRAASKDTPGYLKKFNHVRG